MRKFQPKPFGKYMLVEKVATGGMAQLYRAKITGVEGFEKLIAIKKILPHLNEEAELITAFIDEAKLAALLHHQNIVQIYDFGSIEETYYIAMEFLYGKDLKTISLKAKEKNLPLPVEYVLFIMSGVCAGLDYAHKLKDFQGAPLNIAHRDISPQNILITYEGDIKIVDFGIAKAASKSSLTETGMIKGKVAYMSPEQAGGSNIDHRSDIFSAGIMFYELITGRRMFQGDTLQILGMVRNAEFEPPETVLEGLPDQLYQIINRALSRDREQRYQSCAEMYEEIEECLASFSLRPNSAGLSKYMKSLFTEEIATETRSLKDVSRIIQVSDTVPETGWTAKLTGLRESLAKIPGAVKRLWSPLKEKVAEISARGKEKASQQPKLWIGIASGGALALILVLGLVLFRGSGSTPDPDKAEHPPATATSSVQDSPAPDSSVGSTQAEPTTLKQAKRALENKDYVLAVKLFQETLKQKPSLVKDIAGPYAQALRGQGSTLIKNKPKEAKKLLQKAVEIDPHTAENHFQLGLLFAKLKQYPEAIKAYKKAGDLDPKFSETFFNLGFVYAITKDYEDAEKMFRRVTELKPPYLDEAYSNLAVIQEKQGKRQEAIKSLEQALEVNPDNQKARKYLDRFKG